MAADRDVVLVVDDDIGIRRLLNDLLVADGYGVVTASDGREALQQVVEANPSIILLDVRMPVMDGAEFLRAFRVGRRHPPPIVVMTAAADAKAWSVTLKADAYVGKPFESQELLESVGRFRRGRGARAVRTAPEVEFAHF